MTSPRIPLLLLPGLLCDAALYEAQIAALGDIAAPIVGDLTRHDSIEDMAAAMLAEMPEYFSLVGLSMGGDVALTPPALHEEMAAMIQGAELVVAPACGHLSTLERPDAVNEALRRWLGR